MAQRRNSLISVGDVDNELPRLCRRMSYSAAAADLLSSLKSKSSQWTDARSQSNETVLELHRPRGDLIEGVEFKTPILAPVRRPSGILQRLVKRCRRSIFEAFLLVDNTAESAWTAEDDHCVPPYQRAESFSPSGQSKEEFKAELEQILSRRPNGRRAVSVAYPTTAQVLAEIFVTVPDGDYESCSVMVSDFSSAAEVCKAVDPRVNLLQWQLQEVLEEGPLSLVRLIEDHEPVGFLNKLRCPDNCRHNFQLTKSNSKYNMAFEDTQEKATNSTTTTTPVEQVELKPLSHQLAKFRPSSRLTSPPTYVNSGFLWFRLPGKSWKKQFCFLHGSSLFYSTRSTETSARYMRLLVELSSVDIWTVDALTKRNVLHAPTPYILICRPISTSRVGLLSSTLFATRTEEGRLIWENSFRIHKYGLSRLKSNHREAEGTTSSSAAIDVTDVTTDPVEETASLA